MTNLESPRSEPERQQTMPDPAEQSQVPPCGEPRGLADVIADALAQAEAIGSEIPEWGARAIARSLAARIDTPTPSLNDFDLTADADLKDISREVMPLYNEPDCSDGVKRQIDYLLTFLLRRQHPLKVSTAGGDTITSRQLTERAHEGIRLYGDAFRAFLKLPDISVDAPALLETFDECYIDRFASMDDLLDSLTERNDWQSAVDRLADQLGIAGYITLDQEGIAAHARDTWDIVRHGDALYVFEK